MYLDHQAIESAMAIESAIELRSKQRRKSELRAGWKRQKIDGTAELEIGRTFRLAYPDRFTTVLPSVLANVVAEVARGRGDTEGTTTLALLEMALLYSDWLQRGRFGFNQKRLDGLSDRVRKLLVATFRALESRGLASTTDNYAVGLRCYTRTFHLPRVSAPTLEPLDTTATDLSKSLSAVGLHADHDGITNSDVFRLLCCGAGGDVLSCSVVVGGSEFVVLVVSRRLIESRSEAWAQACLVNGWFNASATNSEVGEIVNRAIGAIRLPGKEALDSMQLTSEQRKAYLDLYQAVESAQTAGKAWCFDVRERFYHPVTSLPRAVKKGCKFEVDGVEIPAVQPDVHGMYWCVLIAMMEPSAEKDELIRLVQSRAFYLRLAEECGLECNVEFKIRTNAQCLFYRHWWAQDKCEISTALAKLFPELWALIKSLRSRMRIGEFSDLLCAGERSVMGPALLRASELGPALPLHDALVVPETIADQVVEIIQQVAIEVLGFVPAVKF